MKSINLSKIPYAKQKSFPRTLYPELAFLVSEVPNDDQWLHEEKFDGYRILSFIQNNKIQLVTRNGNDWSIHFPHLIASLKSLKLPNAILDGEIVVLDDNNISNFQQLQNAICLEDNKNIVYFIFDLPYYNNFDLRHSPLIERKKLLKNILNKKPKPNNIFYTEHIQGHGRTVYKKACLHGLEGIVSKKIDSPYVEARSRNWLKVKCVLRQEFVIGGYTAPQGSRKFFGALLVGLYNNKNQLIYSGKVGTGFSYETLETLYEKFKKNRSEKSCFEPENQLNKMKNITWLKPKFVAEIEFIGWASENRIRHAAFLGLRLDKTPKQVRQEAKLSKK